MCYRSSNFAQTSDRIVVLKVVPCVIVGNLQQTLMYIICSSGFSQKFIASTKESEEGDPVLEFSYVIRRWHFLIS